MDLESLKKSKDYLAAQMAYCSAANAVTLGEASGALAWPMLGADRREDLGSIMTDYAAFVRANPSAPAEALFRFGAGRACHDEGHGNWRSIDFVWRIAFTVFHRMLPICDQLLAEEIAALEIAAWVDSSPRQACTALSIAAEDTILETHGSIFEISQQKSPVVRCLGKFPAPSRRNARSSCRRRSILRELKHQVLVYGGMD